MGKKESSSILILDGTLSIDFINKQIDLILNNYIEAGYINHIDHFAKLSYEKLILNKIFEAIIFNVTDRPVRSIVNSNDINIGLVSELYNELYAKLYFFYSNFFNINGNCQIGIDVSKADRNIIIIIYTEIL